MRAELKKFKLELKMRAEMLVSALHLTHDSMSMSEAGKMKNNGVFK